jgi:hypothetical protein
MLGYKASSWDSADSRYAVAASYRECDLLPVARSIAHMHWRISQQSSSSSALMGSREHYAKEAAMKVAVIPTTLCLDLVTAYDDAPKLVPGHPCSKQFDRLWQQLQDLQHNLQQQQQQQSCDWQQHEESTWSWQQQQQQWASWAWYQQHEQQQYVSWMQQQQSYVYWAVQQSLAHLAQQQQDVHSYWYKTYQHYQQPHWYYPQQQQQQDVPPWAQDYLPQQQQQQQQHTSYAPAEYAAYWPHYYCHRPAWMTAAAAARSGSAPATPSRIAADSFWVSSAAATTAAEGFGASPAISAALGDLFAELSKLSDGLERCTMAMNKHTCFPGLQLWQ